MTGYWQPWIGRDYDANRLLLLGESVYSWDDGKGGFVDPSPRHSLQMVDEAIEGHLYRFTGMLTRGLTGCYSPTPEQVDAAWAKVAFTNYVPGSVGQRRESRPSWEQWKSAREVFPRLLADLAPSKVIVIGKTMWSLMPDADHYVTDLMQGYNLPSGGMAMCWAVQHPARGLSWGKLAEAIAAARGWNPLA